MSRGTLKTNQLIASVIRRAQLPVTQNTFTVEDFLAFANEEMDIGLVPHILSYHEDYLLHTENMDMVEGQTRYRIPHRAIGNKLRDVSVKEGNTVFELSRVLIEDIGIYSVGSTSQFGNYSGVYYIEGDEVVLVGSTMAKNGRQISFNYYIRPNGMVEESRIGTISSVTYGATTSIITLFSVPSVFTDGMIVDFVDYRTPYKHLAIDVETSDFNSTAKTFTVPTESIPTNLKRGDYVALQEEIHLPMVPVELHSMLAQRVAARCLEALNDAQGLQTANLKLGEMEQKTGNLIDNRVEGAPVKVLNNHGFLKLRRNRFWRT